MATVRRANVVLQVKDIDLDSYLSKGYTQIDPVTNQVIKSADLNTLESYKEAYFNLKKDYDALQEKYTELKNEVEAVKKIAEQAEEAPKTTRRKKNND